MSNEVNAAINALIAEIPAEVKPEAEVVETEVAEDTEEAAEEVVKEIVKSNKKKFKLKVNGKEMEEEVDLDDEDYLIRELQKAKAFTGKAKEEADLRKTLYNLLQDLKTNPRKVLSDPSIGADIKKMAAEIIEEEIENAQKSPEQLQREQLEARLRELEGERKREKDEMSRRELEKMEEQEHMRYDTLISKALEENELPKTAYTVKKIAHYLELGLKNKIRLDPADVIPLVREEMLSDIKELFASSKDDLLKELIGKQKLDAIRKSNITKAKEKPPVPVKTSVKDTGSGKPTDKTPVQKQSIRKLWGV